MFHADVDPFGRVGRLDSQLLSTPIGRVGQLVWIGAAAVDPFGRVGQHVCVLLLMSIPSGVLASMSVHRCR